MIASTSTAFLDPCPSLREHKTSPPTKSHHHLSTMSNRGGAYSRYGVYFRCELRCLPRVLRFRKTLARSSKMGPPFTSGFKNLLRRTTSIKHEISPTVQCTRPTAIFLMAACRIALSAILL
ncbi:unnamed protein product [Ixodes pacificus]